MAILIKNARVFAPKDLGVVDVLMANERILAVGKDLAPNLPDLQTVETGGMIMTPGFFDQHIHVTGGGGEGGLRGRRRLWPLGLWRGKKGSGGICVR